MEYSSDGVALAFHAGERTMTPAKVCLLSRPSYLHSNNSNSNKIVCFAADRKQEQPPADSGVPVLHAQSKVQVRLEESTTPSKATHCCRGEGTGNSCCVLRCLIAVALLVWSCAAVDGLRAV